MNFLAKQTNFRRFGRLIRCCSEPQVAFFKSSAKETTGKGSDDGENNQPIKYFGSGAATWTAGQSHLNPQYNTGVWYQPYVISLSLAVFLIYFCILREENDVDEKLSMSLYDRIEGLEEQQILASIQYNRGHGLSTVELEKRLEELKLEKQ
ncbi:uncharacterized protein LOC119068619 [Bradysia coprophila]|uniref:uncharacterized protein LOC119068619 n=1 Tax=Bradysia coprophila TaxID=38358 RepID=UPI00187D8048|nr:uncharacterized protein LOC119068619 [Bradysia coprophila]